MSVFKFRSNPVLSLSENVEYRMFNECKCDLITQSNLETFYFGMIINQTLMPLIANCNVAIQRERTQKI